MKKALILLLILSTLLLASCRSGGAFTKTEDNYIVSADGTEYVFLANEGLVYTFGATKFLGKIKGEKSSFTHLSSRVETGLFSCENDPDQNILVRSVPDNEWKAYYRKASLPPIDLSPDHCIRFELIKGRTYDIDIKHMDCGEGIATHEDIKAFLADIRSQKTAQEENLYELVKKPDGRLENCYELGVVYGYFKDEPNLAVPFYVTSFNDKAYSIRMDGMHEYVFPEKWLSELTKGH